MPLDSPGSIGTACTACSRLGLGVKERGANGLSGQRESHDGGDAGPAAEAQGSSQA